MLSMLVATIGLMPAQSVLAQQRGTLFEQVVTIAVPSSIGAHEPSLTSHDGSLYMSWMEQEGKSTKIMMSVWSGQSWSDARLVHQGTDLFVNWADFPNIAVFDDGTIAVHWLREIGPSSFDYRIEIALSHDEGISWTKPVIPHEDESFAQHGFVSMLPTDGNSLAVIWLDGRAYGRKSDNANLPPDAMQLRATTLTNEGVLGPDQAVDFQTCSCCQTSLAETGRGTILAAYRDRKMGEIRDISVARLTAEGWQTPVSVHDDGWELSGCPVNGPSIGANGEMVVVAWFTGANDVAAVHVSFSSDAGRSFGDPIRVDLGDPVGRTDLVLLEDGDALISWIEWVEGDEVLIICRVEKGTGCVVREVLATNSVGSSMNFPRIARLGRDIYIAWTQPNGTGDRIAMRRATLSKID